MIAASGDSSRTAATPASSAGPPSSTAASSAVAPLDTAAATAACNAVRRSDDRATGAPAYVRPSASRTAAPLAASARPIAPRASTTSLASSVSSRSVTVAVLLGSGGVDEHGPDPHPAALILTALGAQPQPVRNHLGAGQRHAAEFQRQQAADGVDVEILFELHIVELAEVLDRQPCGHPKLLVGQLLDRRDLIGVVLVGDLADDLLQHVLDRHQPRGGPVFVDQQRHVVAVALHLAQQLVKRLGVGH